VTVTPNWHWPPTAIVAPARLTLLGLVSANVPPHTVVVALLTVRPLFNVSLNVTPVKSTVLAMGFAIVNVNVVVAFTLIGDGLNDAEIEGGATTVSVAVLLGPPVPPSFEVTVIRLLLLLPAVVPVTLTENVHVPLAANIPPDRLMTVPIGDAVGDALPQVPAMVGLDATNTPVGRL
jgi:hypothetical protein